MSQEPQIIAEFKTTIADLKATNQEQKEEIARLNAEVKRLIITNGNIENSLQSNNNEKIEIIRTLAKTNEQWDEVVQQERREKQEYMRLNEDKAKHIQLQEKELVKINKSFHDVVSRRLQEGSRKAGPPRDEKARSFRSLGAPGAATTPTPTHVPPGGSERSLLDPNRMPMSSSLYQGNHTNNPREWYGERCVVDNLADFFGM